MKGNKIIRKLLSILATLAILFIISSSHSFAEAVNYCVEREGKCPVSDYPGCEKNQQCGLPNCVIKTVFENGQYWFYCALAGPNIPTLTPIPTVVSTCGYAGTAYDACCTKPGNDGYCLSGNPQWIAGNCTCINPTPIPTSQLPTSQPIDFNTLGNAIPGLKDIFKPQNANRNVAAIINSIFPYLFIIAGLLLLFYLIAGGFQMMIAANDEKGLAEAKGKITNALAGFLLLFISYWLVQIIEVIFGIKIL